MHLIVTLCLLKVIKVGKLQHHLQRNKLLGNETTPTVTLIHWHAHVMAKIPSGNGEHGHRLLVALPAVTVAAPPPALAATPLMSPSRHTGAVNGAEPDTHTIGIGRGHGAYRSTCQIQSRSVTTQA